MSSENYQYMKPYGDEGIKIIEEMNEHHKDITEFALDCIDIDDNDKIICLDVLYNIPMYRYHYVETILSLENKELIIECFKKDN